MVEPSSRYCARPIVIVEGCGASAREKRARILNHDQNKQNIVYFLTVYVIHLNVICYLGTVL